MLLYLGDKDHYFDKDMTEFTYKLVSGPKTTYINEPGLGHDYSPKMIQEVKKFIE